MRLVIADNGIGIDMSIINGSSGSLGMQLIKGLSRDIKGRLHLGNDHGTRISVTFQLTPLNRNHFVLNTLKEEDLYELK